MFDIASKVSDKLRVVFLTGEEISIAGNTHFLIDDPGAIYWVQEEGGDLFLFKPNEISFIPIFLIEAAKEDLILPPPAQNEGYALFFVSSRKTTLRKLPFSALLKAAEQAPEILEGVAHLLDRWIVTLLTIFATPQKEVAIGCYFKINDETLAKKGETLALARTLLPEDKSRAIFIQMKKGSAELCGNPDYTFAAGGEAFYPFSFALWMQVSEDVEFAPTPSDAALLKPGFWQALAAFQKRVFQALVQKRLGEIEHTLRRMQEKKKRELEQYQETFYKLGSVLNEKITVPSTYEGSPLFKAMDLIGQKLKVKIKIPSRTSPAILDQIREISLGSGIYYRRVALHSNWWKEADQPILGFYGAEKQPVALLRRKGRTYEMIDPVSKITKPAPLVSADLAREAFVFYEGFPKRAIRFRDFVLTAVKKNIREGFILLLVAIAGGILNLFLPYAMEQLFETVTFGRDLNFLAQYTIGLVIVAFASSLFALTRNFAIQRIEGLSKNQIESSMWGRLLELPASFFRRVASGMLMNNAAIFQTIRNQLVSSSVKLLMDNSYCVFYLILMFTFNATLTLIGIAGMLLALIIYAVCILIAVRLTSQSFTLASTIQGVVVQIISGIPKIRVAGAESRFFGLWGNLFSQKKKVDIKLQYTSAIQSLVFRLFPWLMTVVLFATAISIFKESYEQGGAPTISMGTFFGFATAFSLFYASALEILETLSSAFNCIPYWKKAKFIIEEPLEKQEEGIQSIKLRGGIALDHVYFRYDPASDWILRDLSIVANPGEMVGIVGPSGCGKSTIVRLLLGFEAPVQGDVLYDEFSLKELDLRNVRKQIGVVLQNAGILSGSIYENIVGAGSYSVEDIERAVKLSGFQADLETFPMGLNTILPMGGGAVSGGQRQRLYLARALVASPKILILDEATSALDNKTQELVSSNLDEIDVTRIVIAHRLSTIKHADRIYVIEAGSVVESGTFYELVEKNGLFAEMLRRQSV